MDLQLTGKRAIVTGASRGIGLATANRLAEEGVDLVIAARSRDPLNRAAKELQDKTGRRIVAVTVDTRDDESVRTLVAESVDALGGVDILVNSAAPTGIAETLPQFPTLAETTDDHFWHDVDTKVVGYLRTARAVAPYLVEQGWGRIINVSGLGSREARSIVRTVRNVSVAAMTKNIADELGPKGVNAVTVHPGPTVTENFAHAIHSEAIREGLSEADIYARIGERNSIGRVVTADEVASVIAFLASPLSVAISGDVIAAGGGQRGVVHY